MILSSQNANERKDLKSIHDDESVKYTQNADLESTPILVKKDVKVKVDEKASKEDVEKDDKLSF